MKNRRVIKLDLVELKKRISYDPLTGKFTWLVWRPSQGNKVRIGGVAGTTKMKGRKGDEKPYHEIGFDGRNYPAHRLAFAFMTGSFPPANMDVDHINGNSLDNRWSNLRLVSRSQNNINGVVYKNNNGSGVRGVRWRKDRGIWEVRIVVNKQIIHLGHFKELLPAVKARREAEQKYFKGFVKES